jgi:hypothetical protein
MSREYEKALQEFAQSNQDFEGRRVAELIVDTGERLTAFCLHEQVAGEAMIGLHRKFCLPDFPSDYVGERSWEALWAATRERHLLRAYQQYYNGTRTHLALAKDSPLTRSVQTIGRILPLPTDYTIVTSGSDLRQGQGRAQGRNHRRRRKLITTSIEIAPSATRAPAIAHTGSPVMKLPGRTFVPCNIQIRPTRSRNAPRVFKASFRNLTSAHLSRACPSPWPDHSSPAPGGAWPTRSRG